MIQKNKTIYIGVDDSAVRSKAVIPPVVSAVALSSGFRDMLLSKGFFGKNRYKRRKNEIEVLESVMNLLDDSRVDYIVKRVGFEELEEALKTKVIHEVLSRQMEKIVLELYKIVTNKGYDISQVVIDAPRHGSDITKFYYCPEVKANLEGTLGSPILVEENSDERYPEVAMASILARYTYLKEKLKWAKLLGWKGSGQPGDRATEEFLKGYHTVMRSFAKLPHLSSSRLIRICSSGMYHVLTFLWVTPEFIYDVNLGVGDPYIVLRKDDDIQSTNLEYIHLRDLRNVNVKILGKRCPGILREKHIPCVSSYRFGAKLVGGKELCKRCRSLVPWWNCTYKKPKCDGSAEEAMKGGRCKDPITAGSSCSVAHGVYLYVCGDKLKVGMTKFSRIPSRLLEQGASNAIVFSPFPNRLSAWQTEDRIYKFLISKNQELTELGINEVRKKRVRSKVLSSYFFMNWKGGGEKDILRHVKDLLLIQSNDEFMQELASLDTLHMRFWRSYKEPPFELREPELRKRDAAGKVVGFRGSLLYLKIADLQTTLDLHYLKRHVIVGGFYYE